MDDENNGYQCYIIIKGTKSNLLSSKASGHFTFMGLTDATGDPLLCICILASQSLIVTYVKVFGYCASIPYNSSKTTEENMGEGNALPGLPVWKFRGESIPGSICMSPKGSTISYILTEALKYLDQLNAFERRQDGPTPFGLLDIHRSRLRLPLMEYINSATSDGLRNWIKTLITPNSTNVWQVGESIK